MRLYFDNPFVDVRNVLGLFLIVHGLLIVHRALQSASAVPPAGDKSVTPLERGTSESWVPREGMLFMGQMFFFMTSLWNFTTPVTHPFPQICVTLGQLCIGISSEYVYRKRKDGVKSMGYRR